MLVVDDVCSMAVNKSVLDPGIEDSDTWVDSCNYVHKKC